MGEIHLFYLVSLSFQYRDRDLCARFSIPEGKKLHRLGIRPCTQFSHSFLESKDRDLCARLSLRFSIPEGKKLRRLEHTNLTKPKLLICREIEAEEACYLRLKRVISDHFCSFADVEIIHNIDKLEKLVNEGNYYGAQQMYKSLGTRYVAAERFSEALDLLQSGACIQLAQGQVICGAELAFLFAETLEKGKIPYDDETLDRVKKIYDKFPRVALPSNLGDDDDMQKLSEAMGAATIHVDGCSSFLKAAIRWSAVFGPNGYGSPELHNMLAEYIYSESPEVDMAKVTYHFVRGNDPKKLASTIVNFMGKCYPGEDDMAIARAILRLEPEFVEHPRPELAFYYGYGSQSYCNTFYTGY
ncbi:Golgi to ER traffic protein 4-like protein [Senna tora]|uniref:Golgi to ER traffic protein 4-like protein n=1 Tax=Senna tora TaxID=362788 RepID=A0A834WAJ0_9FABA|nr:Golgi to ER traffic protein 4-like protein [Senna tora]